MNSRDKSFNVHFWTSFYVFSLYKMPKCSLAEKMAVDRNKLTLLLANFHRVSYSAFWKLPACVKAAPALCSEAQKYVIVLSQANARANLILAFIWNPIRISHSNASLFNTPQIYTHSRTHSLARRNQTKSQKLSLCLSASAFFSICTKAVLLRCATKWGWRFISNNCALDEKQKMLFDRVMEKTSGRKIPFVGLKFHEVL